MSLPNQANLLPAVRFGVVGIGGYAGVICRQLLQSGGNTAQLLVACDPEPENHGPMLSELARAGVAFHRNIDELLRENIDAVWLPVPIDLHRPFAEKALRAGKAVVVEKPAAGCIQDVDAMIDLRDRHKQLLAVGFQHLYDPQLQQLRREIRDGLIGRVLAGSVRVCWPRDEGYYRRTAWAGRMQRDGVWILDSPANNAMAHHIAMLLYLLAPTGTDVAEPAQIEAELYRANPIENFDTCSLRIGLGDGVSVLVLLTHACRREQEPAIVIRGERGAIRMDGALEIQTIAGATRRRLPAFAQLQSYMQESFYRRFHGEDAPIATLEMARAHTLAINGAAEAAAVRDVPVEFVQRSPRDESVLRAIAGIEEAFEQCQAQDKMLHESGLAPWSAPASFKDLRGYCHFSGPLGVPWAAKTLSEISGAIAGDGAKQRALPRETRLFNRSL